MLHFLHCCCVTLSQSENIPVGAGGGVGGEEAGQLGEYFILLFDGIDAWENFVVNMFKMDDRSAEIDPSSDVTDGESDTTGKYFNFKNAPS